MGSWSSAMRVGQAVRLVSSVLHLGLGWILLLCSLQRRGNIAPETYGWWQGSALKATSRRLVGWPPLPRPPLCCKPEPWLGSEGPILCRYSFPLLLSPASANKTVNQRTSMLGLPLDTFVCAGRGCRYASQRTCYTSGGSTSLDFFFYFCRSPPQRCCTTTFKIVYLKYTVTLFGWDHRLHVPC